MENGRWAGIMKRFVITFFASLGVCIFAVFSAPGLFRVFTTSFGEENIPFISPVPFSTSVPSPTLIPKPRTLEIPKLGVQTTVEFVGLDDERRMDVPKEWENVGWYQYGPIPGEAGSAVIAGHLDSPTGPAVFYDLSKLQPGDSIVVTNEQGNILEFIVEYIEQYKDVSFPIQKVFNDADNKKRLNLITCAGTFSRSRSVYSDRLVVFASLKGD